MPNGESTLTAALNKLAALGTERDREQLLALLDRLDAPVLAGGVELVDTPGTGSVFQRDTQTARETLPTMDAAVFVLTADPPVSASERDLLSQVADLSVTTFAVLNKADHLDEAGLAETSEFTTQVLAEAGHPGTVYPMSARAALRGGDAGFTAFETDFTAYLSSRREADLRASAIAQARRVVAPVATDSLVLDALERWGHVPRHWRLGEVAEATVLGDSDRLVVALDALLENAVAHTEPGDRIEVSVRLDDGRAVIAVTDSGCGIPPIDLDRIFGRFARAEPYRSGEAGGFGLGLPIVQAIAEAHLGSVRVHSGSGHGATFELVIPAVPALTPLGNLLNRKVPLLRPVWAARP